MRRSCLVYFDNGLIFVGIFQLVNGASNFIFSFMQGYALLYFKNDATEYAQYHSDPNGEFNQTIAFMYRTGLQISTSLFLIFGSGIIGNFFQQLSGENNNKKPRNEREGDPSLPYIVKLLIPEGRINRLKFWIYSIIFSLPGIFGCLFDHLTIGRLGIFSLLGMVIGNWVLVATHIKRCHDRNRSGWFFLLCIVPIFNLWYLIELGFLKGSPGINRYEEPSS